MILTDLNGFGLLCPVVWLADRLRLQMATNGPIRTSRRQLGRHYTSGQIYARPSFISRGLPAQYCNRMFPHPFSRELHSQE